MAARGRERTAEFPTAGLFSPDVSYSTSRLTNCHQMQDFLPVSNGATFTRDHSSEEDSTFRACSGAVKWLVLPLSYLLYCLRVSASNSQLTG